MEDHTTTDSTLRVLFELRRTWPWVGAVLQTYLHRTLDDCKALAGPGSRVRLVKGAYAEPPEVAIQDQHEVDLNYVRCLNVLLAGEGYPMFATHDPRLIEIIGERARWYDKTDFEYQMLYGIRPEEQRRLGTSRLCSVRRAVVRISHAATSGTACQRDFLPAVAGQPLMTFTKSQRGALTR